MIRFNWRDEVLDVRRLVLSPSLSPKLREAFKDLAQDLDIDVDSDSTIPQRGDLWVGAIPTRGWGSESKQIGWAQGFEAYLVLELLRRALPSLQESELVGHHGQY